MSIPTKDEKSSNRNENLELPVTKGLCNVWAITHWVRSEEYIYPAPCMSETFHLTFLAIFHRFSQHPIVPGLTL